MTTLLCPHCGSENIYFSKKDNIFKCEDCRDRFDKPAQEDEARIDKPHTETDSSQGTQRRESGSNTQLLSDEYWCDEFMECAPLPLASSYRRLKRYSETGETAACDMAVRDVFELMLKIPVFIIFNRIYELIDKNKNFMDVFEKYPEAEALFKNSLTKLSPGKLLECANNVAKLNKPIQNIELFTSKEDAVYKETAAYLDKIKNLFRFRSADGESFTNMVYWRNISLAHGCLAENQEINTSELASILEMFKKIAQISLPYYKKVFLADSEKKSLSGAAAAVCGRQIYIGYKEKNGTIYLPINGFIIGSAKNLSLYNGFLKGRARMLNYATAGQCDDEELSGYMNKIKMKFYPDTGKGPEISGADIYEDGLESADINSLEEYLSEDEKIEPPVYFYNRLRNRLQENKRGIFHISAEMGMGKSRFTSSLDQLNISRNTAASLENTEDWKYLMSSSCIRVWHFNSTYYGRKSIYLKRIKAILNTLEVGGGKQGKHIESNMLESDTIEMLWDSLMGCEESVRHIKFSQILNETAKQHFKRNKKERFILILDGADEPADSETLFSFLPYEGELNENVYILLATRSANELSDEKCARLKKLARVWTFEFTRDHIKDNENCTQGNEEYKNAVLSYVLKRKNSYKGKLKASPEEIASMFNYRFSELSAYFHLCDKSEAFMDICKHEQKNTGLIKIFMDYVKKNSTEMFFAEMKRILQVLCFSGDELTLGELAFLSGEGCVSFRFLGMLSNLSAFITVKRNESDSESRYGFSHEQWRDETAQMMPDGGVYFRRRCAGLLDGFQTLTARRQALKILENGYEGERWLLIHLFEIYNTNYKELKGNLFEDIKISAAEDFMLEVLSESECGMADIPAETSSAADKPEKKQLTAEALIERLELEKFLEDYIESLNTFGKDSAIYRERKPGISFSKDSSLLKKSAFLFKKAGSETKNIQKMTRHLDNAGYFINVKAAGGGEEEKSDFFRDIAAEIIKKIKDVNDRKLKGKSYFLIGRHYHYAKEFGKAAAWFSFSIDELKALQSDEEAKEYLLRAYTRRGRIGSQKINKNSTKDKVLPALNDLGCAYDLAKELTDLDDNALYLNYKRICEDDLAALFESLGDINAAISLTAKALETSQEVLKRSDSFNYRKKRYFCMKNLAERCIKAKKYEEAFKIYEAVAALEISLFNKTDVSTLERLLFLSYTLGETEKHSFYTESYESYIKIKVAVSKLTPVLDKLAQLLADGGDLSSFVQNDKKNFSAIFHIAESDDDGNYFSLYNGLQTAFYENIKEQADVCKRNTEPENAVRTPAANEVFILINKYFPRKIVEKIPIETMLWLKTACVKDYEFNLDKAADRDFHPDTLALLKSILVKAGILQAS